MNSSTAAVHKDTLLQHPVPYGNRLRDFNSPPKPQKGWQVTLDVSNLATAWRYKRPLTQDSVHLTEP